MLVIINYGMGNLGSIYNMLRKIGADAVISSDPNDIEMADKLILPGVGSFDSGMKNLDSSGLISVLNKKVLINKTPILGVCLGMHLFTQKSEEGSLPGLGWINCSTVKFNFDAYTERLKIPHMGWNTIQVKEYQGIFHDMYDDARFYFVHSYYIDCHDNEEILSTTFYGKEFVSSINKENIYGTQFHPEKSHRYGLKLLKNFVELK